MLSFTPTETFHSSLRVIGIALLAILLLFPASQATGAEYDEHEGEYSEGIHSQWDHNFLTYGFVNGTPDIAGDGEQQAVREGMELWADETPLTFWEVEPENAEIKISWGTLDGVPGFTLAKSNFPSWPLDGDVLFDEAETWTTGTRNEQSQPIDLMTVAAHEIGHSLGVAHLSSGNLMHGKYVGSHRWLYTGDQNAITYAYGNHLGRRYYLRNDNTIGTAALGFEFGQAGDRPIAGDWDGDGEDTIGFYRPSTEKFYLRNSNSGGSADVSFSFGESQDLPVVGDWNEDGTDTVGIYRPSNGSFYLTNSHSSSCCSYQFAFGNKGDIPIAGDWNNSGTDTIGLYRPSTGVFYLKNTHSAGSPDYAFAYGNGGEDYPVAGDWNGDGYATIGVVRSSNGYWYLEESLETSVPEHIFPYGTVGPRIPITGDWNDSGNDTPGTVQD